MNRRLVLLVLFVALGFALLPLQGQQRGRPQETGPIFHHSANAARAAGLRSRPTSGAAFQAAIVTRSTTTWF